MSDASFISDYPALRRPRLTAGVGAKTATGIWAIVAVAVVAVGFPWGLIFVPIGGVVHGAMAWFFKKDSQIMALYVVHEVVPNNLYAGFPSHGEMVRSRPRGYASNIPLN